MFLEIYK